MHEFKQIVKFTQASDLKVASATAAFFRSDLRSSHNSLTQLSNDALLKPNYPHTISKHRHTVIHANITCNDAYQHHTMEIVKLGSTYNTYSATYENNMLATYVSQNNYQLQLTSLTAQRTCKNCEV